MPVCILGRTGRKRGLTFCTSSTHSKRRRPADYPSDQGGPTSRTSKKHACRPWAALGHFDAMIADWFSLTYVLNNLNRGLGLLDAYPFVLSNPAIEKLRFVHDVIKDASTCGAPSPG